MTVMASQITSLTIIYSIVYSRRRSTKTSKLRVNGLCEGNSPVTGEFPARMTSNTENVSIWWRHGGLRSTALTLSDKPESVFCLLLRVSTSCAWPITRRVPSVTPQSHHTPGPRTGYSRDVLYSRAPCGAVRILPLRTGPVEFKCIHYKLTSPVRV